MRAARAHVSFATLCFLLAKADIALHLVSTIPMATSIFMNISTKIAAAVTSASPGIRGPVPASHPPVTVTRDNAIEMKKTLGGSVLEHKNGTFTVLKSKPRIVIPSDASADPVMHVSKDGTVSGTGEKQIDMATIVAVAVGTIHFRPTVKKTGC